MPTGEKGDHHPFDHVFLADDDLFDFGHALLKQRRGLVDVPYSDGHVVPHGQGPCSANVNDLMRFG
ncbi:hypothetical protein GCM10027176_12700 [Actinoallomurus bryophytorum]